MRNRQSAEVRAKFSNMKYKLIKFYRDMINGFDEYDEFSLHIDRLTKDIAFNMKVSNRSKPVKFSSVSQKKTVTYYPGAYETKVYTSKNPEVILYGVHLFVNYPLFKYIALCGFESISVAESLSCVTTTVSPGYGSSVDSQLFENTLDNYNAHFTSGLKLKLSRILISFDYKKTFVASNNSDYHALQIGAGYVW